MQVRDWLLFNKDGDTARPSRLQCLCLLYNIPLTPSTWDFRPYAQSYRDDTFLGLEAMVTPGISHPIGRLRRGVYSSLRTIDVFQPVKVTNDRIWHLASSPGRRQSRSREYHCLDGRTSHCRSSEILEGRSHEYITALQLT